MNDTVVQLRPSVQPPCDIEPIDDPAVANLMAFCERLDDGMKRVASVLVQLDSRVRRLELALNKMEREKTLRLMPW